MKRSVGAGAIILVVAFGAGTTRAQDATDPAALETARELVELTTTKELQEAMMAQTWPILEPAIREALPDASPEIIEVFRKRLEELNQTTITKALADTPALYAKYFTAQELSDVMAFYKTPTGKKTIAVMPQLQKEIMTMSASRLPEMMRNMIADFTAILKKESGKK